MKLKQRITKVTLSLVMKKPKIVNLLRKRYRKRLSNASGNKLANEGDFIT